MKPVNYDRALIKAQKLCSKAEHCPKDIIEKVQYWGLSYSQAVQVAYKLQNDGYINLQRFTNAYVHDKLLIEHVGRRKIAYNLLLKDIPAPIVKKSLEDYFNEEDYLSGLVFRLERRAKNFSFPFTKEEIHKLLVTSSLAGYETDFFERAMKIVNANRSK